MNKKNIFNREFWELTGCIHNHSEYSYDCNIAIARIIREAKLRRLDYLTINDHNTLQAAADQKVLQEKELLIIVGMEINDSDRNHHFLVFNSDEIKENHKAEEYVKFYRDQGAVCFAAHPIEKRFSNQFRKYEWQNKELDDFAGIEIWNYLSEWIGKVKPALNGLPMILFPSFFVVKPHRQNLRWWDQMNLTGKKRSAIGSVDAHTEQMKRFGIKFKILRHRTLFKTIRTNVLIPSDQKPDAFNIINALKNGNSYIVNYKNGDPRNFYAGIAGDIGNATFGEEISMQSNLNFYFNLPRIAKVDLFKNGKKINSQADEKGCFPITSAGNYRLEITRFRRGWIFTNNIFVLEN
jgi:hypothetical protein